MIKRFSVPVLKFYVLLLVASHLYAFLERPAPSPPASPDAPVWILRDPLDRSDALLRSYSGESNGTWAPPLAGLNTPGGPKTFEALAGNLPLPENPVLLIANGHAGAVAFHFAAQNPDAVSGLVLLNATGVQELSLLGEYHLNYALYAVSETALSAVLNFVPHFERLPRLRQQRDQIRTLRHSDRRALRPLFAHIHCPVLLLDLPHESLRRHATREHLRLLPQSRVTTLQPGAPLGPVIDRYLTELSEGRPATRGRASQARLQAAAGSFDAARRPPREGWALWLLLFAISVATLFTEDLTCAVTGLMIANGTLTWTQGIGACLAGILVWDYLIYLAGRILGRPALQRIPLRWMIDPVKLRETEEWFDRRIGGAIFVSRLIPGTRLPAYLAAGILNVPAKVFTFYFVLAAVIWTPLIILLSAHLAEIALEWIARFQHTAPALIVAALLLYALLTHLLLPACSWRGRRKLIGRWRRLTRAEFLPARVLYLPVFLYLILRSLRQDNRLFDFTACNPCMPAGGFSGESKTAILDQFTVRDALAPYLQLSGEFPPVEQRETVTAWMTAHGLSFPIVVKPDTGEKGQGVCICADPEALTAALETARRETLLVQEAQTGCEYGISWEQRPGQPAGHITGIARKIFPVLTGDGKRNLEDLILADPHAVCQAGIYFERLRERLYEIPAAGESVQLTDVGNHHAGARFADGKDLCTPALQARIREISESLPGFFLGRYDLFAPDDESLRAGQNIKIIELNGVSSEPAALHLPAQGLFRMTTTLVRQWQAASEIGKHHRQQGAPILTMREFLHLFDAFSRRTYQNRLKSFKRKPAKPKHPQP